MELLAVTIEGYRRFGARTTLQTNGKLVALLGPNEAGKSSLLSAIAHLGHTSAVTQDEVSRHSDPEALRIVGRFFLDRDDLAAAGLSETHSLIITKRASGRRVFSLDPPPPARDCSHRPVLTAEIAEALDDPALEQSLAAERDDLPQRTRRMADVLGGADETLDKAALGELQELADLIAGAFKSVGDGKGPRLARALANAVERERAPTPLVRALGALQQRVPGFLLFDEDARDLECSYAITALRKHVPTAFANLADVAELSLGELFRALDEGRTSRVTTLEQRASRTLGEKFRAAWRQSGISVALRVQGDAVEVQIVDGNAEYSGLSERSDGLRQFVALQMFATRAHADRPILLIDEAEQRLHYDAQADLVQMLARQQLAPKVIYTTHSAGCLPEDLGNGVRTVVADEASGSSRVVNRFWTASGSGLAPLLFGLGASTMAFFPTRRAVMVEGPSDMLLFPTLFREALGLEALGFQFVPGLSQMESPRPLGSGVLYLVDGDPGGAAIRTRLLASGVSSEDVFVLRNRTGTAFELEDFVSERALVAAANQILEQWHPDARPIDALDEEAVTRMSALEAAFEDAAGRTLPKVDLAYGLLAQGGSDPGRRLLDPRRASSVAELARSITSRFEEAGRSG